MQWMNFCQLILSSQVFIQNSKLISQLYQQSVSTTHIKTQKQWNKFAIHNDVEMFDVLCDCFWSLCLCDWNP